LGRPEPTERNDSIDLFPSDSIIEKRLADLSDDRLAQMDATGVDVQVMSLTSPGVKVLGREDAAAVARRERLVAETVRRADRYPAFATLPTAAPEAVARELERSVTQLGGKGALPFGRTGDRNADDPTFLPIYRLRRICVCLCTSTRSCPRESYATPTILGCLTRLTCSSLPAGSGGTTRPDSRFCG
jgi:predicted TIM-barrel fold metal-dependent hydrolase